MKNRLHKNFKRIIYFFRRSRTTQLLVKEQEEHELEPRSISHASNRKTAAQISDATNCAGYSYKVIRNAEGSMEIVNFNLFYKCIEIL